MTFICTVTRCGRTRENIQIFRGSVSGTTWHEAFAEFAKRLENTVEPLVRRGMKEEADASN